MPSLGTGIFQLCICWTQNSDSDIIHWKVEDKLATWLSKLALPVVAPSQCTTQVMRRVGPYSWKRLEKTSDLTL